MRFAKTNILGLALGALYFAGALASCAGSSSSQPSDDDKDDDEAGADEERLDAGKGGVSGQGGKGSVTHDAGAGDKGGTGGVAPRDTAGAGGEPEPGDAARRNDAGMSTSAEGRIVFDFDFRAGQPTPTGRVSLKVSGGQWQDGWRTVSGTDQLIIDAGEIVAAGFVEATFTMKGVPWQQGDKLDWIGVFENPDVHQRSGGDLFFLRTGEAKYGFSMPKAYGKAVDMNEWFRIPSDSEAAADRAEWSTDDAKDMTVRLEWKDGIAIAHHPNARVHRCPESICSAAFPIDEMRYVALGRDGYSPQSLIGLRFRRVRMVAY